MALALSTSWNSFNYLKGEDIILEIKNLGFKEVELNFNLTFSMVREIASLVKREQIKVLSLHNFCPVPEGVDRYTALPDYYSMSSLDEAESQKAVEQTKRSIDTALELNAKVVVLHSGRVQIPCLTSDLIRLYNKGLKGTKEYKKLMDKMIKQRRKYCKPYVENTLRNLEILNRYAQSRGIFLGIENRFYYHEIPCFEEIGQILNTFKGAHLLYWHDTGHAHVLENLGIYKHKDYLRNYHNYMVGVHLHDVRGVDDHIVPHRGEIDFNILNPYIKKDTLKVIEAHYPATGEDIIESKVYLESVFDGKL